MSFKFNIGDRVTLTHERYNILTSKNKKLLKYKVGTIVKCVHAGDSHGYLIKDLNRINHGQGAVYWHETSIELARSDYKQYVFDFMR